MKSALLEMTRAAAEAVVNGSCPQGFSVAPDYPTEFSLAVAQACVESRTQSSPVPGPAQLAASEFEEQPSSPQPSSPQPSSPQPSSPQPSSPQLEGRRKEDQEPSSSTTGRSVGPFFIVDESGVIVGEIGGHRHDDGWVEIGYAVVESRQRRGHATRAVIDFVRQLPAWGAYAGVVAHTPSDRPASARVLQKAGFSAAGELTEPGDEHGAAATVVNRWRLEPGV